jgi:iron complex transport system substrate-binding protein
MTNDLLDRPTPMPDILDDLTRREFITMLAAAGLLAACGGRAESGGPSAATRTIEHSAGTSQVPISPDRIVTLGGIYVATLINLGLTPVAIGDQDARQLSVYKELLPEGTDLAGTPTIGDPYEPNLEAVAAQRPDLILGDEYVGELYDKLSAIAPTVLVAYINNGGWRERFPGLAEAAGKADLVAGIDAEYRAAIDALPDSLSNETVAFVRADADGAFRIDSLPSGFAGSVAEDAGIPTLRPEGVGEFDEGSGFITLSGEQMGVLEGADVIVLADNSFYDPEEPDSLSQLQQNPLWNTLPAVKAGRLSQIPGPIYNGGNYYAARLLLKALAEFRSSA